MLRAKGAACTYGGLPTPSQPRRQQSLATNASHTMLQGSYITAEVCHWKNARRPRGRTHQAYASRRPTVFPPSCFQCCGPATAAHGKYCGFVQTTVISGSEAGLVYLRHTGPLERLQETNRNLPWPGTISMTLLARSVWPCTVCPSMPAMIFLVPSLPAHTTRAILPAGEYFRSFSSRVHALTVAY